MRQPRRPEQKQGLVDEVGAEVEQNSAALRGVAAFAPDVGRHAGAEALEARLEADDVAERAVFDQAPHGEEVTVPAAIMESRHAAVVGAGLGEQRLGIARRDGQRLVDDDRETARERLAGERRVHAIGGRDDGEVAAIPQVAGLGDHGGSGMGRGHLVGS